MPGPPMVAHVALVSSTMVARTMHIYLGPTHTLDGPLQGVLWGARDPQGEGAKPLAHPNQGVLVYRMGGSPAPISALSTSSPRA